MRTMLALLMAVLVIFPMASVQAELDGCIGMWLFDEGNGDVAKDSSGNGNDGTIIGATWVDGRFGKCLEFSGSGQYVEVPDADILDLEQAVTMVNWFYYAGGGDGWQTFFSKGPMAGTNENYAHFINTGGMYTHFILNAGGGRTNMDSPGSSFDTETWHHTAAVYDGKARVTYIDGEEVMRQATSGDLVPNDNYLGLGFREGSPHYWTGMLDDMALFNRALSQDEIQNIRDNGLNAAAAVGSSGKLATTWGNLRN